MIKIHTAVCSFGMSGSVFHAPFLHTHPGFNFYAVWERSSNEAQKEYPQVKQYRLLQDMLADEQVELVVVNTPNVLHYEHTKMALLAGKHVVCEKPFTVTTAQADELIAIAAAKSLMLTVYQNRRYDSDFKTIHSVLEQQLIGDIVEAEFHFDRFKTALSPKKHKEIDVRGTGALYDLGSHLLDQALQLFGMPVAVFADIMTMRPDSAVDDYFEVLLYYPTKRVRIKGSYIVREPLPGYILHGRKGSFIKPKTDVQEAQLEAGMLPNDPLYGVEPAGESGLLSNLIDGKANREYLPSLKGNYTEFYEGVYQAIRHDAAPPVTASQARDVILLIEAAFSSHEQRAVVNF